MKKEIEVYLAGSIDSSEGLASYTSLLAFGTHRKELSRKIKGKFKEVLYTGVLDTICAMKEPCSITVYTLQKLTFKDKEYAKLIDDINTFFQSVFGYRPTGLWIFESIISRNKRINNGDHSKRRP